MKREKIINYVKLAVILYLFFNLGSIVIFIFKGLGFNTSIFDGADVAYLNALVELILLFIVYLLYHRSLKKDLNSFKLNYKDYMNKICVYFAVFLGLKIGFALVSGILSALLGVPISSSENQNIIDSITNNAPVMMFISTCILAPFVEEGIFRLGLRSVIKEKYLFIAISGLVFGFMHIFPTELPLYVALIQSIVYVAMGICLAYMYTETDNIWITIIIHALNNFLSMAAILIF
mgnify:FL=1